MQKHTPVLIIGAGPTGLTAALTLKQLGIDCVIIDKKDGPTSTSNAAGVQARTLELWEKLGIVDRALELGKKITDVCAYSGSKQLFDVNFSHIDSPYQMLLLLPQSQTEQILREALKNHQVEVLQSHTLVSLEQDQTQVTTQIKDADGNTHTITTDHVIGADGFHSTVRECVHIPFQQSEVAGHFMMMDVPITNPDIVTEQVTLCMDQKGILAIFPMREFARVIIEFSHDPEFTGTKDVDINTFKAITKQRCLFDVTYGTPTWQSVFYVHEGIVDRYHEGRVFLAGDAAHVHSPAGGQGMNLGIQDAYCLAHKLKQNKLDTYQEERKPKAEKVIKMSGMMLRGASLKNSVLTTVRNAILPHLSSNAKINNLMASHLAMLIN